MLNLINKVFKRFFSVCILVAAILVVIAGFALLSLNPLFAFLTWAIGFIMIILATGLIGIFINIDNNLQKFVDREFGVSQNKKEEVDLLSTGQTFTVIKNTAIRSTPEHGSYEKKSLNTGDTVYFQNVLKDDPSWYYVESSDASCKGWCFTDHLKKFKNE